MKRSQQTNIKSLELFKQPVKEYSQKYRKQLD
jgi:hypothetical protein